MSCPGTQCRKRLGTFATSLRLNVPSLLTYSPAHFFGARMEYQVLHAQCQYTVEPLLLYVLFIPSADHSRLISVLVCSNIHLAYDNDYFMLITHSPFRPMKCLKMEASNADSYHPLTMTRKRKARAFGRFLSCRNEDKALHFVGVFPKAIASLRLAISYFRNQK